VHAMWRAGRRRISGKPQPAGHLKDLKRHDQAYHAPYSSEIMRQFDVALCELNGGALTPP
jgi:hypothetical protein